MNADYFDGRVSRRHRVEVAADAGALVIQGEGVALRVPAADVRFRPRVGRAPIRLLLPGGALLVAETQDLEEVLPIPRAAGLALRLESHLAVVLVSLALVLLGGYFAYRDGLPWVARAAAHRIPVETEHEVANEALAYLDKGLFAPTTLPLRRRHALEDRFRELISAGGVEGTLHFRSSRVFGANALALGGGVVVVTDALVSLLDDERVTAVLAHEIGHLHHRHAMRRVLQASITGLVAAAVVGDAGSIAGVAAALPTILVSTAYSRAFEEEADAHAHELLRKTGRPPSLLGMALETLEEQLGAEVRAGMSGWGYLATHPPTEERSRASRDAPLQR